MIHGNATLIPDPTAAPTQIDIDTNNPNELALSSSFVLFDTLVMRMVRKYPLVTANNATKR